MKQARARRSAKRVSGVGEIISTGATLVVDERRECGVLIVIMSGEGRTHGRREWMMDLSSPKIYIARREVSKS